MKKKKKKERGMKQKNISITHAMIHFGKQCTLKNSRQRICNLSLLHLPVCVCVCVCVRVFDMLSLTNAGAVPKQLINMHINQMCVIACVCVHE